MALRAFFVDVGNTLVRERPSRFAIYAECARARGVDLTDEGMQALMRQAHRELPARIDGAFRYTDPWFAAYIQRIYHHHLGLERSCLAELSEGLFARFSDPSTFELFPGALELLDELRAAGLKIGVISNWSPRLPGLLASLGLAQRLDFVLCSAIEEAEKPDAELFLRALARAEVAPHEALHAGDDLEKDVLGARRAGVRAVLVDHADVHARLGVSRARDLAGLLDLVRRLAA